jgi:dTDP-4-dehydrorhamnose reductase
MRYLVIGASGQVGKSLMRLLGDGATGTAHTRAAGRLIPLDLADVGAVGRLIRDLRPEGIFVPGGVTAVDWCESHEAEARRICVDGTVAVREAAESIGAHVVFFSTDYVFSGNSGPYREEDPPDPVSVYGRVKAESERAAGEKFTVLRTSMVYSDDPDSRNFHNFVVSNLKVGRAIKAYTDQSGSPTSAPWLAKAALAAMVARTPGLRHAAGPEVITRRNWALKIARAFDFPESLVQPVTSEEFPMPARRPSRGGLRLAPEFGPGVTLETVLAELTNRKPR